MKCWKMYRVRTSNIGIIAFIYVHSSWLTRKHKDWLCDRTSWLYISPCWVCWINQFKLHSKIGYNLMKITYYTQYMYYMFLSLCTIWFGVVLFINLHELYIMHVYVISLAYFCLCTIDFSVIKKVKTINQF